MNKKPTWEEIKKNDELKKQQRLQREREKRIRAFARKAERAGITVEELKAKESAERKSKRDHEKAEKARLQEEARVRWIADAPRREAAARAWAEACAKQREEAERKRQDKLDRLNAQCEAWQHDELRQKMMPKVGMTGQLWWREYGRLGEASAWRLPATCVVVEIDDTMEQKWCRVSLTEDVPELEDEDLSDDYTDWGFSFGPRNRSKTEPKSGKSWKVWRGAEVKHPTVWKNMHLDAKSTGIVVVELDWEDFVSETVQEV